MKFQRIASLCSVNTIATKIWEIIDGKVLQMVVLCSQLEAMICMTVKAKATTPVVLLPGFLNLDDLQSMLVSHIRGFNHVNSICNLSLF